MKYYAAKCENWANIYDNWQECKAAIEGVKGVKYKSFPTREEAEAFVRGGDIWFERLQSDVGAGFVAAYTDGSFDNKSGRYAWGCVIFDVDGTESHLSGVGDNTDFLTSHNVAGEVFGVLAALQWAKERSRKKINICHDYSGLAHWAKGEWKTNTKIAQFYKAEFDKYKGIEVAFTKIAGHSNNPYNDKADKIAREALKK